MTTKQLPPESEAIEPDDELSTNKLRDLEQHIYQRINRLGETDTLDREEPEAFLGKMGFIPPFEPLEPSTFLSFGGIEPDYQNPYEGLGHNHPGINDQVLASVQELSDTLTQSLLNLNVRLNSLEEKIASGLFPDGRQQTAELKTILSELQQHTKVLEGHISQNADQVKQKIDEQQLQLQDQLTTRATLFKRLTKESSQHTNRHLLSLAILLIVVAFISSALIIANVDRLSGYLAEQQESLHLQLEQLTQPHAQLLLEPEHP